jgi:NitT/TauT family transport system substrate-binding protein
MSRIGWRVALMLSCLATLAPTAHAEQLKLAVGQRGNWDTSVAELGQRAGIFKKHDLELELLYTAGGGETQQAVLSRSVDIGVAAGTLGVLGAAAKGAPVRIIAGETTGAADLFWYVPAASPLKTVADLAGKTVAFSTVGSSTDTVGRMAQAQFGVMFQMTPTGGLPATYTQVMSGQIDSGWAAAPFGVDALAEGKIRAVFRGSEIKAASDQTIRVLLTHAGVLAARKDALVRFMQGYRETLDYMYSNPDAIRSYAAFAGVSELVAQRTRDQYFPRPAVDADRFTGLDAIMADGVRFKFMAAPLTAEQIKQVVVLDQMKP